MIPYQHTKALLQKPVREFFCPEIKDGSLSYADPVAYRAQDLCRSANIVTLDDLKGKAESDLRAMSFSTEVIDFIRARLNEINLHLKDEPSSQPAFSASAAVTGVLKVIVLDSTARAAAYAQHFTKK